MGDPDNNWDYQDSDEDDSTADWRFGLTGKVALLCIIDCTPEMFDPWGTSDEIPFLSAIRVCQFAKALFFVF